ncbi:MAG TPA: 50S ribosomal protein L25 [Myxococcota bacterium]|nr:50S ribosomal protein L25 [Myxococcota bacterium]
MTENILTASIRQNLGKGPARRMRMNEQVPAVVYRKGKESIPIVIGQRQTTRLLLGPFRRNVVINLEIENDSQKNRLVMVKERQIHPVRRNLTHVDFVEIEANKPVTVAVPLKLGGKSEAVTLGGKLDHVLAKMKVSCLAANIPEFIDVDISNLSFGSTHTKDIPLPAGLKLAEKPRVVVLTIKKPRGAAKEEEASKEGAAAKPAPAAAAAPKPKK